MSYCVCYKDKIYFAPFCQGIFEKLNPNQEFSNLFLIKISKINIAKNIVLFYS